MRTNILALLDRMAAEEAAFRDTRFVAPCVAGGMVRVRVAGIVQTFAPVPSDFAGWGVFAPETAKTAWVIEEADLPLVSAYLAAFPVLRVRLVRALAGQTWLGYPVSEADRRQRFSRAEGPLLVHLVTEGTTLDVATVRSIGGAWWFEDVDRRADPLPGDKLRDALTAVTEPGDLRFPGLTPEMRTAYDLLTQSDERFVARRRERAERLAWEARASARRQAQAATNAYRQDAYGRRREEPARPRQENDGRRLRDALAVGGGDLRDWADRGDYWLVEWTTSDGERHTSAIAKADLTVVSSGVCLSGRDRDFDLQSLVRVIEQGTW